VFATTNPYGAGHAAVKRRFIDPAPYGHVVKKTIDVFNPRTQQREPVTKTQVTIFGSYKENIYLSPEYIAELESISDENIRAAWLWGIGILSLAARCPTCGERTYTYYRWRRAINSYNVIRR
jgi:hypothetical protein